MNERTKELAEQAGYLPDMFGIGHWDMPECKRFADLIRQDEREACAKAMQPMLRDMISRGHAADLIRTRSNHETTRPD